MAAFHGWPRWRAASIAGRCRLTRRSRAIEKTCYAEGHVAQVVRTAGSRARGEVGLQPQLLLPGSRRHLLAVRNRRDRLLGADHLGVLATAPPPAPPRHPRSNRLRRMIRRPGRATR